MTFCYIPLVQWADSPQALVSLRFQSALLHSFIDNTLNLSTPVIVLCCSNVVQVPLSLNPFQLNLEFGTTHRVALCVVHPRYTKSNRIYNKSQN